jgi:hypothetical protein
MAANFSAKALGTFSGDGMMTLDRMVEATLLQNNGPTTNHPQKGTDSFLAASQGPLWSAARYDCSWPIV